MSNQHIIEFVMKMQGSQRVIKELETLEKSGAGVKSAFQEVTKTVKLNDTQMLKMSGTFNEAGTQFQKVGYSVLNVNDAVKKANPLMNAYTKALARVAIVVPMWAAFKFLLNSITGTIKGSFQSMIDLSTGLSRAEAVAHGTAQQVATSMDMLKARAEQFARTNAGSAQDVTEAFYRLGTAGIGVEVALDGSVKVAELAKATWGEVATVGAAVAGIYNVLGDSISGVNSEEEKMEKLTNVLATAWSNHRVELSEIQKALGNVGAQAKRFGLTMEQTIAVIATSSDNLIESGRAGTLFGRILDDMVKHVDKVEVLLGETFKPNEIINWMDVFDKVITKIQSYGIGTKQAEEALQGIFGDRARRQAGIFITELETLNNNVKRFVTESDGMRLKLLEIRNNTPEVQIENFHENVEQLMKSFVAGFIGVGDFTEGLKDLNTQLSAALPNVISTSAAISQFGKNASAGIQAIGVWLGGTAGLYDEILQGNITIEEADKILKDMYDEIFANTNTLSGASTEAVNRYYESLRKTIALAKEKKAIEKELKEKSEGTVDVILTEEDMNLRLKTLKTYGATELQLAAEKVRLMSIIVQGDEESNKLIEARLDLLAEQNKILMENAKQIRSIFSSSLSDALKEGDLSSFFDNVRTGLKDAFYDAVSEGLVNQIMNLTGLDVALGQTLDTIRLERVFTEGSLNIENALNRGFAPNIARLEQVLTTSAVQSAGYAPVNNMQMASIAAPMAGFPERMQSVPIAPADYYKSAAATGESGGFFDNFFGAGGNFGKLLGVGLLASSLMGGIGRKTSMGQAYSSAPASTSDATTRSTVKAKVTNIVNNVTFNLDGMSIDEKKTMAVIGDKIGAVIKDTVSRILENEEIGTGNL